MKLGRVSRSLYVVALLLLVGLWPVLGCGKGTSSSLKGQVTLAGKAVQDGDLVLRPNKDTPGPPVATKIAGGKYEFTKDKKLVAGKYLVLVTAMEKGVQYIPDKYNVGSSLTVDLAPGANDKDFALEAGMVTVPPTMKGEQTPPAAK
jgi:hypothetical protein